MHNIANIAAETAHHLQILATLGLKTTAGNLNRSKYHATKDNKQERRPKRPPTNKIAHHQFLPPIERRDVVRILIRRKAIVVKIVRRTRRAVQPREYESSAKAQGKVGIAKRMLYFVSYYSNTL
mmetsp:Transcript_27679/g.47931  ORF Transcript_27679/g.47931 Transcript_27679/m.47931 type:complete len:124 (-) Transcript_27679:337-708(-)